MGSVSRKKVIDSGAEETWDTWLWRQETHHGHKMSGLLTALAQAEEKKGRGFKEEGKVNREAGGCKTPWTIKAHDGNQSRDHTS